MSLFHGPAPVLSGLILYLDAANPKSYPGSGTAWFDLSGSNNHFTLYNSPTLAQGALNFNGSNQYARSTQTLNLSVYSYATVEIWFKVNSAGYVGMVLEHTGNWNSNSGGFGLYSNSNGGSPVTNLHHTNHNSLPSSSPSGGARNYLATMGTQFTQHVNQFSKANDSTGRLTYVNSLLTAYDVNTGGGSYGTETATTTSMSLANDYLYLASRGGGSLWLSGQISIVKVYATKLSQDLISQNYNATRGRYGL